MQTLTIDPDEHMVQDLPFTKWMRKELGCEEFMTYWHRRWRNWVAGIWVNRMRGQVKEYADLGPDPSGIDENTVRKLKAAMFSDLTPKDIKEGMRGQRRKWYRDAAEMQDAWNHQKAAARRGHGLKYAARDRGLPIFSK